MAKATTSKFSEFVVLLGDGEDPEVFTAICGLTSKGFTITNNTQSTAVPDCANEDLAAYNEKLVDTQDISISGSGVWAQENHDTILQWALDGTERNVRVQFANAASGDIEFLEGPAILTTQGTPVTRGQRLTQEIEIMFSQKPTTTDKA